MILVDTSVLINFFRGRETAGTRYLETLISEEKPFCINEFIYQELLQGSKDEKEFSTLMPRASILDAGEKELQSEAQSICLSPRPR